MFTSLVLYLELFVTICVLVTCVPLSPLFVFLFNLLIVLVLLVVSSQHLSCPGYAGSDPGSVCCNKPSILQINLLLLAELRATNQMVSILGGYQEGEEQELLNQLHRLH